MDDPGFAFGDLARPSVFRSIPLKRLNDSTKCGFPLDRFVDMPRVDFICRICNAVVRDSKECTECGLLLCGKCWETTSGRVEETIEALFSYRERNFTCPHCNQHCYTREPSHLLKRMIQSLLIRCKHSSIGCTQLLPLSDLKVHQGVCPYKTVACGNFLCCTKVGRRDSFLKVKVLQPVTLREATSFVCSEICRRTLLLYSLIFCNSTSAAVSEFHSVLTSTNS